MAKQRETGPGPIAKTVADNMRRLRKRQSVSLTELSARLGALGSPMSVQTLSKLENGKRDVSVDDLDRLAAALEVPSVALTRPAPSTHDVRELVRHWGQSLAKWNDSMAVFHDGIQDAVNAHNALEQAQKEVLRTQHQQTLAMQAAELYRAGLRVERDSVLEVAAELGLSEAELLDVVAAELGPDAVEDFQWSTLMEGDDGAGS